MVIGLPASCVDSPKASLATVVAAGRAHLRAKPKGNGRGGLVDFISTKK